MQAYAAGLVVFGIALVFGLRQGRRIVILRTRGCAATVTRLSGVWAEFEVPGEGVFRCYRGTGDGRVVTGDKLVVLYDPRNPRNCEFKDHGPGWPMAVTLFVLALVSAVVCAGLISLMLR